MLLHFFDYNFTAISQSKEEAAQKPAKGNLERNQEEKN
jgi:hypothetical protein